MVWLTVHLEGAPVSALLLAIRLLVATTPLRIVPGAPLVRVVVSAPGVKQLRLWCSTGALSSPEPAGEGRFEANYRPPATGAPGYVLLAAWNDATGEAGATTLALGGRTEIPIDTEPGAQVVAVIHGRRTTARADGIGHARVVVWVWPGEHAATVTALDAAGNGTTTELPIDVPRPPGVFLLTPAEVAPDVAARVFAFTIGTTVPELAAPGASLTVAARPGLASAQLRTLVDVTVTATAGEEQVQRQVHVARAAAQGPFEPTGMFPDWAHASKSAGDRHPPQRTSPPPQSAPSP
jgi:hypothetical protein